jgi:hypothetical protein
MDKKLYGKMADDVKNWAENQTKKGIGDRFKFPEGRENTSLFTPAIGKDKKPVVYELDIIPYIVTIKNHPLEIEAGDPFWTKKYWRHTRLGSDGKTSLICPKTIGKNCPICNVRKEKIDLEGYDKDKEDPLRAQEMDLFNVFDHNDPDKGVQLFSVPYNNFGKMLKKELDANEDAYYYLSPTSEGKTIEARFVEGYWKKRTFIECDKLNFIDRGEDVPDDILDEALDLDELLVIKDEEEIMSIFLGMPSEEKPDPDRKHKEAEPEKKEAKKESVYGRRNKKEPEPEPKPEPEGKEEKEPEKLTRGSRKKTDEETCPFGNVFGTDAGTKVNCDDCEQELWTKCTNRKAELRKQK